MILEHVFFLTRPKKLFEHQLRTPDPKKPLRSVTGILCTEGWAESVDLDFLLAFWRIDFAGHQKKVPRKNGRNVCDTRWFSVDIGKTFGQVICACMCLSDTWRHTDYYNHAQTLRVWVPTFNVLFHGELEDQKTKSDVTGDTNWEGELLLMEKNLHHLGCIKPCT